MGWGDSSDSSNSDEEMLERRAAKRARQQQHLRTGSPDPEPQSIQLRPQTSGFLGAGEESLDAPIAPPSSPVPAPSAGKPKGKGNSVWADVLNEQTLTAELSRDVGVRSGERGEMVSRDVESFPLPPQSASGGPAYPHRHPAKARLAKNEATTSDELDMELDAYKEAGPSPEADDDPFADLHTTGPEPLANGRKRLGRPRRGRGSGARLVPIRIPALQLSSTLSPIILAGKLAQALKEPKTELIERVVNECGAAKAIELYERTQKIQAGKGLHVADKSRLRSPGGVLLFLLREDASVQPAVKQKVFAQEKEKSRKFAKVRRKAASAATRSYEQILADAKRAIQASKEKAKVEEMEEGEMGEEVEEGEVDEEEEDGEIGSSDPAENTTPSPLGDQAPDAPEILA